jgi:hypothetical protein
MRRSTLTALLVLAVPLAPSVLAPRVARAQAVSASDRDTARSLMQEGDVLRDKRDLKGALERYQAADAIMHVTTTGLAVAKAQADLGLLVEAHDTLSDVMRVPAKPNEPAAFAEARGAAQTLYDELEGRIPSVRVVLDTPASQTSQGTPQAASVTVDGAVIPPAALIAYRRVNPGHHVIVAKVGPVERRQDVTLAEREKREVRIDLGGVAAPLPEPTAPATLPPLDVSRESAASSSSGSGPWKALSITGITVGVAGILVGSITGIVSISKANAAKAVPANQGGCVGDACGPATHSDIDTSVAMGNVSTAAFIVGGAGLALGVTSVILQARGRRAREDARASDASTVVLSPWLGPLGGGVSGSF